MRKRIILEATLNIIIRTLVSFLFIVFIMWPALGIDESALTAAYGALDTAAFVMLWGYLWRKFVRPLILKENSAI